MGILDRLKPRKPRKPDDFKPPNPTRPPKPEEVVGKVKDTIEGNTGVKLPSPPGSNLAGVLKGKSLEEALRGAEKKIAEDVRRALTINQIPDRLMLQIGEEALGDVGKIMVQTVHGTKILAESIAVEALLAQLSGENPEGFDPEFLESPEGKTALALAASIVWSRDYYLKLDSTKPLPSSLKELMKNGFSMELLDTVRIAKSEAFDIALPGPINAGQKFFTGHEYAVTLDNVIVFSKIPPESGLDQLQWWAHELYHVKQYGDWGIAGFAERYVKDWAGIENEASEKARKIVSIISKIEQMRLELEES